jgi:sodium transport system ATP-binding protein
MREAERLCDRIAILHRGSILAAGTLDELRAAHDEQDLEELFFRLVSRREAELAAADPVAPLESGV